MPTLTDEEARRYWLTTHGPLVRSHALARGLVCYQQVHRYDSPLAEELRGLRGTVTEPYLGYAEAWFDRIAQRSGPELDATIAAAVGDEHIFIDFERSAFWSSKEHVFVDRSLR